MFRSKFIFLFIVYTVASCVADFEKVVVAPGQRGTITSILKNNASSVVTVGKQISLWQTERLQAGPVAELTIPGDGVVRASYLTENRHLIVGTNGGELLSYKIGNDAINLVFASRASKYPFTGMAGMGDNLWVAGYQLPLIKYQVTDTGQLIEVGRVLDDGRDKSAVVLCDGSLYVGLTNGVLARIDAEGQEVRDTLEHGAWISGMACWKDGIVLIINTFGQLFEVNVLQGTHALISKGQEDARDPLNISSLGDLFLTGDSRGVYLYADGGKRMREHLLRKASAVLIADPGQVFFASSEGKFASAKY